MSKQTGGSSVLTPDRETLQEGQRSAHVIHLCGDLMGKGELTRCGIRETPVDGGVHIVGQERFVNCRECLLVLTGERQKRRRAA